MIPTQFASIKLALLAVLATGSAIISAQASAAAIGVRPYAAEIPETDSMSEADKARATVDDYAYCLLRRDPQAIDRTLSLPVAGVAFDAQMRRLITNDCLASGELKLPILLMRGALYTALYRSHFSRDAVAFATKPMPAADALSQTDNQARVHAVLLDFADCVVRKDPVSSRALILGPTASSREARALQTLMPSLASCIPKGATVHVTKQSLYGLVAEALYLDTIASMPSTKTAEVAR